jgi:hypothetical protein
LSIVVVNSVYVKRVQVVDEIIGLAFDNVTASDKLAMTSLILAICQGLVCTVELEVGDFVRASSPDSRFNSAAGKLGQMRHDIACILLTPDRGYSFCMVCRDFADILDNAAVRVRAPDKAILVGRDNLEANIYPPASGQHNLISAEILFG